MKKNANGEDFMYAIVDWFVAPLLFNIYIDPYLHWNVQKTTYAMEVGTYLSTLLRYFNRIVNRYIKIKMYLY